MAIAFEWSEMVELLIGFVTQNQLEEAFLEACLFKCLGIGNILLTHMNHEQATYLCWNITKRAIRGLGWEMLNNIFRLDAWAYDRFPLPDRLLNAFFPMLHLSGLRFGCTSDRRDQLKVWRKLINEFADLNQVDAERAGVLPHLAKNGAAKFGRSTAGMLFAARRAGYLISSKDGTAESPIQANEDHLDQTRPGSMGDDTSVSPSAEYSDEEDTSVSTSEESNDDEGSEDGDRPIFETAYKEMIRALLEPDVDSPYHQLRGPLTISEQQLNIQDIHGKTALHYAIENKESSLVGVLLEKGVNCVIEDKGGLFPWELPG
ncbi:uncharacterized protein LAJ45_03566 [Morchella importuna]|uniref:uncharacterized protein n=1 Tax=Morchella importuna TaxID=1174673 RepID=UPI001E8CA052|nr:uncharacterized protein LAJ45_03566 [Morchella importuna]KAH8152140.1 hypothetical protein LAJ45_03566 [Morchella importuna]